jgi:hypothetical protein
VLREQWFAATNVRRSEPDTPAERRCEGVRVECSARACAPPSRPHTQERGPRRRPPTNRGDRACRSSKRPDFIGLQSPSQPLTVALKSAKSPIVGAFLAFGGATPDIRKWLADASFTFLIFALACCAVLLRHCSECTVAGMQKKRVKLEGEVAKLNAALLLKSGSN